MQGMAHRLGGKVALVTGGAAGLGAAIVERLAEEGAKVAIGDIQLQAATETAEAVTKAGGTARAYRIDVTGAADVENAVAQIERDLGPIDVLVNNVGWDKFELFVESLQETWDRVIAINYRGALNCCRAVAPRMKDRGHGKIVSLSSDAGRVGSTGEAVYAGCKAGIIGFSKTLARELARYNITVNVVCPGPTDTPLLKEMMKGREKVFDAMVRGIPMRRLGKPTDLANAVAFFASSDSDFVTGQVLSVSGGLTMVD